MRRRLTSLALILLLGAATSLAFAWFAAVRTHTLPIKPSGGNWVDADSGLCWGIGPRSTTFASTGWELSGVGQSAPLDLTKWRGVPIPAKLPASLLKQVPGRGTLNGHLRCTGFPARCLWGAVLYEQLYLKSGQSTTPAPNRVAVHLLTPSFMTSWLKGRGIDGALPTGILWRGLLLNTLFYSALLWLTLHLPLAVRRALRTSHGRCLSCGYDLRATPPTAPCPECGATRLTVSNTQT